MKNWARLVGKLVEVQSDINPVVVYVQLDDPKEQCVIRVPHIAMLCACTDDYGGLIKHVRATLLDPEYGRLCRNFAVDDGYRLVEVAT